MFTGLIEEVGRFISLETQGDSFLLRIEAPQIAAVSQIGDSIAVNGCCLTIVKLAEDQMHFNLLQETLRCTNLGTLHRRGNQVNCEPSLAVNSRLGGHFVQGHVDTIAAVTSTKFSGKDKRLEIEIPSGFAHYLISKGSIAVNGVSLTIAELTENSFITWIIPHTLEKTNLGILQAEDAVNLEFDVLAKYVERLVKAQKEHTPSVHPL